jgi:fructosamine-3-kinase
VVSAFARRVAQVAAVPRERLRRLAGGDLSEVLLVPRADGRRSVAKSGPAVGAEAAMLRAIGAAGVPVPLVEAEHEDVLLLEHVPNDAVFSDRAWHSIGAALRRLHGETGERYGWPVDYRLGTIGLPNREGSDWPAFWAEQRLLPVAAALDRPWRERVDRAASRLPDMLPASPPPSLLHGDLWSGNILVREGALAALIDPACCFGHCEADLAMLTLFDTPGEAFWDAYGSVEPGWGKRRPAYQLFPALVHLRLFGQRYSGLVSGLLDSLGA